VGAQTNTNNHRNLDGVWVSSSGRLTLEMRTQSIGKDLLVQFTGGEAHIGAVGVGCPVGERATASVITLPGHRDDRLAQVAAERISAVFGCACTVVAGVHYDDITPEEIQASLKLFKEVLEAFIADKGPRPTPGRANQLS